MWESLNAALKNVPEPPTSLYPLAASAAKKAELASRNPSVGDMGDAEAMFGYFDSVQSASEGLGKSKLMQIILSPVYMQS